MTAHLNFLRRHYILLPFILVFAVANAQHVYKPKEGTCTFMPSDMLRQEKLTRLHLNAVKDEWKKEADKLFKVRNEKLHALCENSLLISDTSFTNPYQQVFDRLVVKNNLPADELALYISREPWPNAYCVGEGSIVLQSGILPLLDNADETAFVIAHELAHYTLGHSQLAIAGYLQLMNETNENFKKQKLDRQEFGSKAETINLINQLQLNSTRHSRQHETAADSVALTYLLNAGFNPSTAIHVLNKLEKADAIEYPINYATIFQAPGTPFNPAWLKRTKVMGAAGAQKAIETPDSLKTHPDCAGRLLVLQRKINAASLPATNQSSFNKLQLLKEQAYSFYKHKLADYALYTALYLQQVYPQDDYAYELSDMIWEKLITAYQKHELNDYVRHASFYHPESFYSLLQILQRMTINDYKQIARYNIEQHAQRWPANLTIKEILNKLPQ